MKPNFITLCCALLFAFCTNAQVNWHYVGPSTGIAATDESAIEIADDGSLYLAYADPNENTGLTVLQFNDQTSVWDTLGIPGFSGSPVYDIKIVSDNNNYPVVAAKFLNTGPEKVGVWQWDGSAWSQLFADEVESPATKQHAITIAPNGDILLAYVPTSIDLVVYNITDSAPVGGTVDGGDFASTLAMTTDYNNNPVIAWEYYDPLIMEDNLSLSTFDGTNYNSELPYSSGFVPFDAKIKTQGHNLVTMAWYVENPHEIVTLDYTVSTGAIGTREVAYTGSTGGPFEYDYELTSNGIGDVFFVEDNGASKLIMHYGTGSPGEISSGFADGGTFPNLEIKYGVYVVSYVDGGKVYVKEGTDGPVFQVPSGQTFTICDNDSLYVSAENSGNYVFEEADDFYDHSNISIVYESQNTAVIPNGNITAEIPTTNPYVGISISGVNTVSTPTNVNLDVKVYFDGVLTSSTSNIATVTVYPSTNLQFTPPAFCSNDIAVNLNNFATPQGTHWKINNFNYSPIFYPESIVNNTIHYQYTAPNGCISVMDTTIVVGTSPNFTISKAPASCNDNTGSASVAVTAGSAPFTYQWSNGGTTNAINNLSAGLYYITVFGSNGCKRSKVATISAGSMNITGTVLGATCNGENNGSIDAEVTGGSGNLSYYWTHGAYTQDLTNLSAGPYELNVTDENGCVATASFIVPEPAPINIALVPTPAGCSANDGAIATTITGGSTPLTFNWSDGTDTSIANSKNLNSVGAGAYTITVTDNSGCMATEAIMLNNTAGPEIALDTMISATCSTQGSLNVNIISSNGIASTLWSDGSTNQNISASAGHYNLTVTDNNGCVGMFQATISTQAPAMPVICMVSVDSATNTNLVLWKKPADMTIDHYNIYRETAQVGLYQLLDSVDYTALTQYVDLGASPKIRSWRYKISSVNTCGVESELSAYHKTIHLSISEGLPGDYNLSWDDYEGFVYPQFDLYRYTSSTGWVLIQSMPVNLHSYTDTPPNTIGLDYILSIASPNDCTPEKAQDYNSSRSNKANGFMVPGQGGSTTGIAENKNNPELILYPNPTTGKLFLVWEGNNTTYTVVDIQGKLIAGGKLINGKSVVDLSQVETGMYFIQINGKMNKIVVK